MSPAPLRTRSGAGKPIATNGLAGPPQVGPVRRQAIELAAGAGVLSATGPKVRSRNLLETTKTELNADPRHSAAPTPNPIAATAASHTIGAPARAAPLSADPANPIRSTTTAPSRAAPRPNVRNPGHGGQLLTEQHGRDLHRARIQGHQQQQRQERLHEPGRPGQRDNRPRPPERTGQRIHPDRTDRRGQPRSILNTLTGSMLRTSLTR